MANTRKISWFDIDFTLIKERRCNFYFKKYIIIYLYILI